MSSSPDRAVAKGYVMKMPGHPWRVMLVALAMATLVIGGWGGLVRMLWVWPMALVSTRLIAALTYHGPLMICGFLGTLISLERAVALRRKWAYLAPLSAAAGAMTLLFGPRAVTAAQWLFMAAAVVLVVDFLVILRQQFTSFTVVMGLGAVAWLVGNTVWLVYPDVLVAAVPWWVAFLILTIVGERLELSRFVRRTSAQMAMFIAACVVYGVGLVMTAWWSGLGVAVCGVGLLALAVWLAQLDLARHTVRQNGLTRYIAVCLLSGYGWLAIGAVLAIVYTGVLPALAGEGSKWFYEGSEWMRHAPTAGLTYDAILHALLLGFVFTMIFGHAPIIFPAVLGVKMAYRPRFYVHLLALELALMLRVVGDLTGWVDGRMWGGLGTAAAIVLFLLSTAAAVWQGSRSANRREDVRIATVSVTPPP